jgi:hypothetical protein
MAQRRWLGMVAVGIGLSGCATKPAPALSQSEFENVRDEMASSPSARDAVRRQCRADMQREPEDERALIGAMLDLDTAEVAEVFCARFVAAIARGDVSYADFIGLEQVDGDPAALRRILRAIRLDPSAVAT